MFEPTPSSKFLKTSQHGVSWLRPRRPKSSASRVASFCAAGPAEVAMMGVKNLEHLKCSALCLAQELELKRILALARSHPELLWQTQLWTLLTSVKSLNFLHLRFLVNRKRWENPKFDGSEPNFALNQPQLGGIQFSEPVPAQKKCRPRNRPGKGHPASRNHGTSTSRSLGTRTLQKLGSMANNIKHPRLGHIHNSD